MNDIDGQPKAKTHRNQPPPKNGMQIRTTEKNLNPAGQSMKPLSGRYFMRAYRLWALLFLFVLCACNGTQSEYSPLRCNVVIDNSNPYNSTLGTGMTPYSNIFVQIKTTVKNGAKLFVFTASDATSSERALTAIDLRRTLVLGLNNGIIVGWGTLSQPLTFYAFDNECPNCFDPNVYPLTSHPLTFMSGNRVTCKTCRRIYDLNNGGVIAEGDSGKKLTRYRASVTAPNGILTVN